MDQPIDIAILEVLLKSCNTESVFTFSKPIGSKMPNIALFL